MSDQESDSVIMPPPKRAKIDLQEIDKGHVDESNTEYSMKPNEFSFSSSKYEDFVNPEEVEKLKEFQVLDEVKSNDEDSEEESDSSDGKSEVLPEEDIERMLDEDLPDDFKGVPKPKEKPYITRQKIVLEEKGINHFEVLPLDWMMVRHYSGMPVYMHRGTRVCTLSKPYLLGEGNTRRHYIPISAIPCLNYRRALEEEAKQQEIDRRIAEQIKNGTWQKNKTSDPSNKSSDSNRESKEVTVTVETNQTTKGVNLECNSLNSKETHNSDMKTKDDLENGDKLETSSNFVTDKQSRDNLEKNLGDTGVIEKCIPLQNNQINLEDFSNLESNKKGETVDVMSDQQNSKDNLKENNEEGALHVMDSPECSFAAKQDDQMCPVSQNNTEQNCPAIGHLQQNDVNQNDQTCSKTTEAQPTRSAESENSSKEQNPLEEQEEEIPLSAQPVVLPGGIVMPPPRVETVNKSWKTQQLSYEQVNDYCKKLFKFKTVNIMHFERWADRRKYAKARKTLQCPTLLEGTKLITIPAQPAPGSENGGLLGSGGKAAKRDWVMNMNGRSYLSVFHEYVRRALKKQPVYEFKQLENAATPYQATVYIGGMQYGVGRGTSKRLAKANAARASIQILIPEMKDDGPAEVGEPDFSFFDYAGIEDPRITEFCAATCEPSPHATLRTCLLRNFGAGDRHIHTEMKKLEYQKIELTMKVGKHSATVVCKNKKTAKQRASQAILQALHPHVRSWGSLLRLYGSRSVKSCKEKKLEEQQITLLQDKARHNEPNHAVLHKLRLEMQRLRERDGAVVPIGMLLLKDDLPTHSGSNLNNVDL